MTEPISLAPKVPPERASPAWPWTVRLKGLTEGAGLVPLLGALLLAASTAACGQRAGESLGPTGPSPFSMAGLFSLSGQAWWEFDGETWRAPEMPPPCATPVTFTTPVDLARATSVLYPGQFRSNDYRPHGGLRFDGPGETGDIAVVAPMEGILYRGARYLERGDLQYMFDILNECGILHRFDHLRELAPWLQAIADTFPPAAEADSRTTVVAPGHVVHAGMTLATRVGVHTVRNIFIDWGVYDLRQLNTVGENPAWRAAHPGEFAAWAICWLDHLSPADGALVRSLPPGSGESGAASDYCR